MIPLPGPFSSSEALAAIGRLERAGPLDVLGAALLERRADGTRHVAPVSRPIGARIDIAAWNWLLDGILEAPGPAVGGDDPGARLGGASLSQSFVAEVRQVVARADRSLALVVAGLDPGAAVSELRGLPGARLVYGVLPQPLLDRMLSSPSAEASQTGPSEP